MQVKERADLVEQAWESGLTNLLYPLGSFPTLLTTFSLPVHPPLSLIPCILSFSNSRVRGFLVVPSLRSKNCAHLQGGKLLKVRKKSLTICQHTSELNPLTPEFI